MEVVSRLIRRIKEIFENFYYTTVHDFKVVRKIFKSSEFDLNNMIELELITICYRRFTEVIDREKKDDSIEFGSE